MADKRISQLVERTDIANNDVLPIVASGATTTNKVTISTIQDWMQDNLDVGVTSVGLTLGTTGTDVNVTGSPITTSGNITINIPDASASNRGVVTTGSQVFGGVKTFANGFILPSAGGTNQGTRFLNIGTIHEGSAGSNQIGFNNSNNIYFGKGLSNGGVIQWTNAAVRYYTLPDADGTIALTSQLDGYVTLGTAQTITAQKTFTTSGSSDTMIISHGSGSGIALDISKGGNGEGLRVVKTSGSGNAVTITGGLLSAEAATLTGALNGTSAAFNGSVVTEGLVVDGANNANISQFAMTRTDSSWGIFNETDLKIYNSLSNTTTPTNLRFTLSAAGVVTLTGALNGTSASFTGAATTPITCINDGQRQVGLFRTSLDGGFMTFQSSGSNSRGFIGNGAGISSLGETSFGIRSESDLILMSGGNNVRLTIASTGAATFSSSVTATSPGNSANSIVGNYSGGSQMMQFFQKPDGSNMEFNLRNSSGTAIARIDTSGNSWFNGGNVGIGTASPTFAGGGGLHINQSGSDTRLHLTNSTTGASATDGFELVLAGNDV
jgi:hypothetical protein